ncbi:MAG: HAMP domain-containing sensor histidine kinase [Elusimicrobiota bacterium]
MAPCQCPLWASLAGVCGLALGWAAASWYHRRSLRMRARFLSFVAHEINTPVTSMHMTVMNFVNGLFGPVSDEHRPWLILMREQSARLACLIGDLRDFIHVDLHRDLRLSPEAVDLGELAGRALESMKESMARSGAEVENAIETGLPPVQADPDRMARVLAALLTHARKFRVKGSLRVRCSRSEAFGRGGVRFAVEYTGLPLPPGDEDRVLDLFYPVRVPESQVLAGVGLGLGLPRLLVAAHGGEMTLRVAPDGATCIAVWMPA